ncbi:hypothetical protein YC2023_023968 [Brassica napus]
MSSNQRASDIWTGIPYDILVERERERSPKNKHVTVNEGDAAADGLELPIDEWYRNCLNNQASGSGVYQVNPQGFDALGPDLDAFFSSIGTDFDPLLADGEAAESSQFKKASRMCNRVRPSSAEQSTQRELRRSVYSSIQAERAEMEVAHLKDEVVTNSATFVHRFFLLKLKIWL